MMTFTAKDTDALMKDVHARLEGKELEQGRQVTTDMNILDSGAVTMSRTEAEEILQSFRTFWINTRQNYNLDEDEFYVFCDVTGTVSVDKAE